MCDRCSLDKAAREFTQMDLRNKKGRRTGPL